MKRSGIVCLAIGLGCPIFSNVAFPQTTRVSKASPPLRLIQEIPLPGVQGRIDHFTVDAERERLIFSALGNNTVEIVSLFAGRVVHTIAGLDGPQGVLYVPENDRIVVASSGDGKVRVYNGASFDLVRTLDFGKNPDNIRYDPVAKRIYVGYGEDETVSPSKRRPSGSVSIAHSSRKICAKRSGELPPLARKSASRVGR